ncbi:DUF3558 family protein [Amycolatopsis nigrescens]|uniref:DUF3558 family protein n=1 Tax=Amycolatopsis nigrescens TaxID=381445 RepID=UPI00146D0700|nr:DUF3558 family protein [Amycolatopsis nigrescens]
MAAATFLGGCTSALDGTALPVPGEVRPPADPNDPCALLGAAEAAYLGLEEQGEFVPAEPDKEIPPGCSWPAGEEAEVPGSLHLVYSTDQSLLQYEGNSGVQPMERLPIGGLDWARWPAFFGDDDCDLAVELSANSFVMLSSSNYEDRSKTCDLAKAAAPYVSARLPGGAPAPPLTPKVAPPSPLSSVEPCVLLGAEQLGGLGMDPNGRPTGKGRSNTDLPPGCQWEPAAGNNSQALYVMVAADESAEDVAYDRTSTEQVQANGRGWNLYLDGKSCEAILPFTETSAVKIIGGHREDPAQACAQVRPVIPMITANLPPG